MGIGLVGGKGSWRGKGLVGGELLASFVDVKCLWRGVQVVVGISGSFALNELFVLMNSYCNLPMARRPGCCRDFRVASR